MVANMAIDIDKYAKDILEEFNERYRTQFNVVFGLNSDEKATSTLRNNTIAIALPQGSLDTGHTDSYYNALRILTGHELAHHVYDNMTLSTLEVASMCANRVAGNYKKLMMSCCIEIAADIHGEYFYTHGRFKPSEEVYSDYKTLITGNRNETGSGMVSDLKNGYLPPSYRINLMKQYKSFKSNDYSILSDIADDIHYILMKHAKKEYDVYKYLDWIKAQMELDNFPNRPNRRRK